MIFLGLLFVFGPYLCFANILRPIVIRAREFFGVHVRGMIRDVESREQLLPRENRDNQAIYIPIDGPTLRTVPLDMYVFLFFYKCIYIVY